MKRLLNGVVSRQLDWAMLQAVWKNGCFGSFWLFWKVATVQAYISSVHLVELPPPMNRMGTTNVYLVT